MSIHTACSLLGRAFDTAAHLVEDEDGRRAAVYREISERYRDEAEANTARVLSGRQLSDARHVLVLAVCYSHNAADDDPRVATEAIEQATRYARAVFVVGTPGEPAAAVTADLDTLRAIRDAAHLVAEDTAGWLPHAPDGEAPWAHRTLETARRVLAGTHSVPVGS